MTMRVLLATDGSDPANAAIDLVAGMAWPPDTVVDVVMVIETGPGLFGGPWLTLAYTQVDRIEADLLRFGHETVEAACGRLRQRGVEAVGSVQRGRQASVIVERARSTAADLIVAGSRGHGTIESMLLGSVSAEVIDRAEVPVLVARGSTLNRVVLAWDGSECAGRAAALVRDWPMLAELPVRVVSVADLEVPWWTGFPEPGSAEGMAAYLDAAEATREEAGRLASAMAGDLRTAGRAADAEARRGDAASEILAAARAWDADLIVVGTHGRTGLARLLLGSVARNVLHHAPCSVLVARTVRGTDEG
jgi:nucleotide-binding universal stress UspA family protein